MLVSNRVRDDGREGTILDMTEECVVNTGEGMAADWTGKKSNVDSGGSKNSDVDSGGSNKVVDSGSNKKDVDSGGSKNSDVDPGGSKISDVDSGGNNKDVDSGGRKIPDVDSEGSKNMSAVDVSGRDAVIAGNGWVVSTKKRSEFSWKKVSDAVTTSGVVLAALTVSGGEPEDIRSGTSRKDVGCIVAGNGRSSALEAIENCGVGTSSRNSEEPVASVGVGWRKEIVPSARMCVRVWGGGLSCFSMYLMHNYFVILLRRGVFIHWAGLLDHV